MAVHFHEEDLPAGVLADGPVAVDTETMGLITPRDRLCLVQISDGTGDEHLVRFAPGSKFAAPNLKAVLAAGGIATGRQMAAAMAMGAHGAWTGSVWLTTAEAETNPVVKEKMLAASSRDTVRSKSRTGKPSRQLRSPWTDAWEAEGAPKPLLEGVPKAEADSAKKKLEEAGAKIELK